MTDKPLELMTDYVAVVNADHLLTLPGADGDRTAVTDLEQEQLQIISLIGISGLRRTAQLLGTTTGDIKTHVSAAKRILFGDSAQPIWQDRVVSYDRALLNAGQSNSHDTRRSTLSLWTAVLAHHHVRNNSDELEALLDPDDAQLAAIETAKPRKTNASGHISHVGMLALGMSAAASSRALGVPTTSFNKRNTRLPKTYRLSNDHGFSLVRHATIHGTLRFAYGGSQTPSVVVTRHDDDELIAEYWRAHPQHIKEAMIANGAELQPDRLELPTP